MTVSWTFLVFRYLYGVIRKRKGWLKQKKADDDDGDGEEFCEEVLSERLPFYLGGRQEIFFSYSVHRNEAGKAVAAWHLWDPQRLGALILLAPSCPLGSCACAVPPPRPPPPMRGPWLQGEAGPRVPSPVGRARRRHPDQLFRNTRLPAAPPPRPAPGLIRLSGLQASELPAARPGQSAPCSMIWNTNLRWQLPIACLLLEVALIALFGVFVRYPKWMPIPTGWRRR